MLSRDKISYFFVLAILAIGCGQYSGNPGKDSEDDEGSKVVTSGGDDIPDVSLSTNGEIDGEVQVNLSPGDSLNNELVEQATGVTIVQEGFQSILIQIDQQYADIYNLLTLELPVDSSIAPSQYSKVKVLYRANGAEDTEAKVLLDENVLVENGFAAVTIVDGTGHYHVVLIE